MEFIWKHKFWVIWTIILTIIIFWELHISVNSIIDYFMFFLIGAVFSTAFTVWSAKAISLWNNGNQVMAILFSLFGLFLVIGFGTKYLLERIWPDVS